MQELPEEPKAEQPSPLEAAIGRGGLRGIWELVPDLGERSGLSLEELRAELEAKHGNDVEIWQIRLGNPASGG